MIVCQQSNFDFFKMTCLDLHEALLDAVCRHDLPRVKQCLKEGADVRSVHPSEDEDGPIQPVTPLSMVVFKLADNRLRQEDFQSFKDITLWLLLHGADTHHAMALAEQSYGPFDEAWFDESLTVAPLGLIARAHFDRLAAGLRIPSLA